MAKAASKKQAAQNAMMVKLLTYGFLISNAVHLLIVFGPLRRNKSESLAWPIIKYGLSEAIAGALGLTLRGMAYQGDDLSQAGLTSYMFDIIYVTWFTHVTTALLSTKFWYTYLVVPVYAAYAAYTKLLVPFIFKGQDPLGNAIAAITGRQNSQSGRSTPVNGGSLADSSSVAGASGSATSKRQAKLQKRAERGDPRVQARQQR